MILVYLDLLKVDAFAAVVFFTAIVTALVAGISFHEFSHAFTADSMGDPTPRSRGRVTLNPLAHLDPAGTVLLFIVGFGWGKPVPVNPHGLRNGPKAGMALVSTAGPISNLFVAGIIALTIKLGFLEWHRPFSFRPFAVHEVSWIASDLAGYLIFYNLILAIFNLIPLAPLDGFKVAVGILPSELSTSYAQTERYGPMILLLIIGFDYFTGVGILSRIISPVIDAVGTALIGRTF